MNPLQSQSRPRLNRKLFGFTLIELLVVISIIGLLSSVMLANFSGARKKALIAKVQVVLGTAARSNGAILRLHLPLDNGVNDNSGYNLTSSVVGNIPFTQDGMIGGAAIFDGSSYIDTEN